MAWPYGLLWTTGCEEGMGHPLPSLGPTGLQFLLLVSQTRDRYDMGKPGLAHRRMRGWGGVAKDPGLCLSCQPAPLPGTWASGLGP